MRKTISVILAAALIISLCSCGSDVSEYAKEHGQIAVEIVEDYLAGNITADAAEYKLSRQQDLIEKNIEEREKEENYRPISDSLVKTHIFSCYVAIFSNSTGSKSKSYVEKELKELKKAIKR